MHICNSLIKILARRSPERHCYDNFGQMEWDAYWTTGVKHNAKQNGMVFGVLNNMEWKMDSKWNAERDEVETNCSGNWSEMGDGIRT